MGALDGKTCVITGAAGSLGLAMTELFLREGARVTMVDSDAAVTAAAARSLSDYGARVATVGADVSDAAATRAYIEAATGTWGGIDVLVANAGVSGVVAPTTHYPEEAFDRVMAVNVRGPFLACKYGLPRMNDGGSIVIVSSVAGVTSDPGIVAYATSKHAVIGLMRTVAKEAAARRIRCNALCPGPVDNAFQKRIEDGISTATGRDGTALLDSLIPLGRHADAAEIARAALFLASDASSFTTGALLMADGGMHV